MRFFQRRAKECCTKFKTIIIQGKVKNVTHIPQNNFIGCVFGQCLLNPKQASFELLLHRHLDAFQPFLDNNFSPRLTEEQEIFTLSPLEPSERHLSHDFYGSGVQVVAKLDMLHSCCLLLLCKSAPALKRN